MHLGGNMLYLWIFGDNLEHRMGHARFLVFYLLCGLAAGGAHILFNSTSNVPTVGASGAISGVLGGYLLLFPKNRVRVLTRGGVAAVPAMFVLGFWILIQFVNSMGSMATTSETGEGGGVAYLAHVGGFVAGLALVKLFARGAAAGGPAAQAYRLVGRVELVAGKQVPVHVPGELAALQPMELLHPLQQPGRSLRAVLSQVGDRRG